MPALALTVPNSLAEGRLLTADATALDLQRELRSLFFLPSTIVDP